METNKNLITSLLGGLISGAALALLTSCDRIDMKQPGVIDKLKENERKLTADGERFYFTLEQMKRDIEIATDSEIKSEQHD